MRLERFRKKEAVSSERDARIQEAAKKIFDRLNEEEKRGLRYAVVGGVGLTAWTGEEYTSIRPDGSKRDLDLLFFSDPHGIAAAIQTELRDGAFGPSADTPPISIDTVWDSQGNILRRSFLRRLRTLDGGVALEYRDVQQKIRPETLEPIHTTIRGKSGSIDICTLRPMTLTFLYLTRAIGGLKSKDKKKISEYMQFLHKTLGPEEFKREALQYQEFYDFSRQIAAKYPLLTNIGRSLSWIDFKLLGGILSNGTLVPPSWYTVKQ